MNLSCRSVLLASASVAAFVLVSACGGRSDLLEPTATDAGTSRIGSGGADGGAAGAGGSAGAAGGSGGAVVVCAEVPCYAELIKNCLPSGSCTSQTSTASATRVAANVCFSNGVKEQLIARSSMGALSGTITYKRGSSTCFSVALTQPSDSSTTNYVIRDGSGKQVATAVENDQGLVMTCTGGRATKMSDACMHAGDGESDCSEGKCSF